MAPISVDATCKDGCWLLSCTECGPMGVSPNRPDAVMVAERHLGIHGAHEMSQGQR